MQGGGGGKYIDDEDQYVHYTKLYPFRNQVALETVSRLAISASHDVKYSVKKRIEHGRKVLCMWRVWRH